MSYEDGFQADQGGAARVAVSLLEKTAQETGYSSDIINDAYTLALYRAGEKDRLAAAAFQIGDSLVEVDPGSAMDYFQRAFLGPLDAACVRHIGGIFERWAAPKAPAGTWKIAKPIKKVAHVVGCLARDHAPARYVRMLVESLRRQGVESQVFTTEWASSWFLNPAAEPRSQRDIVPGAVIASVEGDFQKRADRVASAIRESGVAAVFYHADLSEQITTRVAAFRPAPIQVNVDHGKEMDPALFDGYIHLTKQGLASTRHGEEPGAWIPRASDISERVKAYPANAREAMGLEAATTVSATFGDLRHVSDRGYLRVLGGLLKRFPKHVHLFAGTGDVKTARAHLHAEGVLSRVRFLSPFSEPASVMPAVDVYLASFPGFSESSLLEAMGAGRPVVAFGGAEDSSAAGAAAIVGIPELSAHNEREYDEIAQRLIRDEEARARCASLVLSRFQAEFAPAVLGPRYIRFLERILENQ